MGIRNLKFNKGESLVHGGILSQVLSLQAGEICRRHVGVPVEERIRNSQAFHPECMILPIEMIAKLYKRYCVTHISGDNVEFVLNLYWACRVGSFTSLLLHKSQLFLETV